MVRGLLLAALLCASCGRLGFAGDPASDAGTGSGTDGDGGVPEVLIDLTPSYQYNANDFAEPQATNGVVDNSPTTLCMLAPPFASSLAILAGRTIYEVTPQNTVVAHDMAPPVAEVAGPDLIVDCLMAAPNGGLPVLYLDGASWGGGDGLYRVTSDWQYGRELAENNVEALVMDDGTYAGTPAQLLFESDFSILSTPASAVEATGLTKRLRQLARSSTGQLVSVGWDNGELMRQNADFSTTPVGTFTGLQIAHDLVPAAPLLAIAITGNKHLAKIFDDGTSMTFADAEPGKQFVSVGVPPLGSSLAPGAYVLEANEFNVEPTNGPLVDPVTLRILRYAIP